MRWLRGLLKNYSFLFSTQRQTALTSHTFFSLSSSNNIMHSLCRYLCLMLTARCAARVTWEHTDELRHLSNMYLMDVDGFSVDTVYQHYHPTAERPDHHIVKHDVGAARRRLASFVDQTLPGNHPARDLQDATWKPIRNFDFTKTPPSQFSSWANPKEKITAMLRMITQVDPFHEPYKKNPEVFTDKVGLFTDGDEAFNEASYKALKTAQNDLYNKLVAGPITAACLLYSRDGKNVSNTPAECNRRSFGAYTKSYGVTAVLYKNANTKQTIIFFQGTYGTSYGNLKNVLLNW